MHAKLPLWLAVPGNFEFGHANGIFVKVIGFISFANSRDMLLVNPVHAP